MSKKYYRAMKDPENARIVDGNETDRCRVYI